MHNTHILMPDVVADDMVEANRLGTKVDYGRGQVQHYRSDRIYILLEGAGKEGLSTKDVASKLQISEGAARHGLWRLRGGPARDGLRHPDSQVVSLVGRNKFVLNELLTD